LGSLQGRADGVVAVLCLVKHERHFHCVTTKAAALGVRPWFSVAGLATGSIGDRLPWYLLRGRPWFAMQQVEALTANSQFIFVL